LEYNQPSLIGLAKLILSNSLSVAQPESLTQSIHSTRTFGKGISGVPVEAMLFLLFLGISLYSTPIRVVPDKSGSNYPKMSSGRHSCTNFYVT